MEKEKYNWMFNIILVSLIFLALLLIITPVYAKSITVNSSIEVINATDTTITWDVLYLSANRPLGALLDGAEIEGFQKEFNITYTATELEPNTNHTFCVYGSATINCETGNTVSSRNAVNQIASIIFMYIFAIIAIVLLLVSARLKIKEVAMVAFIFALLGLGAMSNTNGLGQIIHGLIMIASVILTFYQD